MSSGAHQGRTTRRVSKAASSGPCLVLCALFFLYVSPIRAQHVRSELHIDVHDAQGTPLNPAGDLLSEANQLHRTFQIGADGAYVAKDLPFGVYRLSLQKDGFAPWSDLVEIRSEVPVRVSVTLGVAPLTTKVEVNDAATLVDPYRTGTQYSIGRQTLDENIPSQPGRDLSDRVNDLPGWILEANGVLHPRGSEYDVQYVIDGIPLTENRSPAFAPSFDADDVESMRVLTASYPAEYGRKLGGIVEVTTKKDMPSGLHGQFDAGGGSFSTISASAGISYAWSNNWFSFSADGFHTDRYLDPPVLQNFTNRGSATGFASSYERDFSDRDRLRMTVTHSEVRFLVPNYLVQQVAGQRQDVANSETSGQIYFQHTISPDLVLSFSGSVRDAALNLSSNLLSTPIIVAQQRGYREGYVRADLAGHHGHHDWKIGVDSIFGPVHENLQYIITDPSQFDPGTQQNLQFSDRRWDIEPSAYVQDQLHLGHWNVSAGLRFDHYGLVVQQSAWSPRVGVSRYIPSLNLLIHASYDRVFQTPAVENLLLASSPQFESVSPIVVRLPVQPARANYYEVGVTKALAGKVRLDANFFRRDFHNFADDDVLLDTGISFPIAFSNASVVGEELRLEVPHWWRFSGYLSYANQSGIGQDPITGGLFIGASNTTGLTDTSKFAISQDQRNTARLRIRFEAPRRIWLATAAQYGSGLPADSTASPSELLAQYGPAILDRVNFDLGRVRPNFSFDVAAGVQLFQKERRSASFQIQAINLTDRVNVINFASLFSGTAVAPPRSASARLMLTF
jgi:outer membrane cobalamin receptor